MMMNRRVFSTALLAGAAAAVVPTALAHAPEAGKRAQPGFYRFKEAYSHPRSTRLGRKWCKSTPPSSTLATS
jgi:hypothetical protein